MKTSNTPPDSHTLRNVRRDFPEWHLGRQHYALWALQADTAEVRQRVQSAQAHLGHHLLEDYRRQPHITIGLCGFLCSAPRHFDDFDPHALQAQLAALRLARPAPFQLDVGGLDSFTSVPYLSVQADAGCLEALRLCVAQVALNAPPDHYTPHVTVGLYAGVWPLVDVQAQCSRFADTQALHLEIRSISLVCYAPHEIGGPLQTLASYDFESGSLCWSRSLPEGLKDFSTTA